MFLRALYSHTISKRDSPPPPSQHHDCDKPQEDSTTYQFHLELQGMAHREELEFQDRQEARNHEIRKSELSLELAKVGLEVIKAQADTARNPGPPPTSTPATAVVSSSEITYTVITRGEIFTLTRDQVEFDSPNYFTSCFLGESAESQTRTLTLSRDPNLFMIVLDYLSGYEVLPLHDSALPKRMGPDVARRNLLADARFYRLDRLADQINSSLQIPNSVISSSLPSYIMITKRDETWGPPMPVSSDSVKQAQQKHGIVEPYVSSNWADLEFHIQRVLLQAQIRSTYIVETFWISRNDLGLPVATHIILKLSG
ncbi:hypothetical protein FRC10_002943 [Ceratobasidium sp. 414]|nr:hypothetical protein FRC10_002943 [Ceratobasidium sp. 414]